MATEAARPIKAVVIFADIRGFSEWARTIEAHEDCLSFVADFYAVLGAAFEGFHFKGIGDGALLVREVSIENATDVADTIDDLLYRIRIADAGFAGLVENFQVASGMAVDLRLGWGVARGPVIPIPFASDFLGATINKACRLCDLARPWGVVIERDNFPVVRGGFFEQVRRLHKPAVDVKVWVSEPVFLQHTAREAVRETPEVHVAGVCFCPHRGVLLARRTEDREIFPGKWEGCGGQLRRRESFRQGVIRHFRVELGLTVEVLTLEPEIFEISLGLDGVIPGLRFLCRHVEGDPAPTGHSEVRWVPLEHLRAYDLVPGFLEEVSRLLLRWTARAGQGSSGGASGRNEQADMAGRIDAGAGPGSPTHVPMRKG